jgi:hypothetical protein
LEGHLAFVESKFDDYYLCSVLKHYFRRVLILEAQRVYISHHSNRPNSSYIFHIHAVVATELCDFTVSCV